MKINYSLNNLRGITIVSILYIHTISFLVNYNEIPQIAKYFYSLSSISVPLLFMLSGYLYRTSSNQFLRFKQLTITYIFYVGVTMLVNSLLLGVNTNFKHAFLYNPSSIGYLWFIKVLIFCELIIILYKFNREGLIALFLLFLISTNQVYASEIIFYTLSYFIGYYANKDRFKVFEFIPKASIVYLFILPLLLNNLYYNANYFTLIIATIVFASILKFKSVKKQPILEFYSRNSLELLFFQYFIIEILLRVPIEYTNLLLSFALVFSLCSMSVLIFEKSKIYIRGELSKQ